MRSQIKHLKCACVCARACARRWEKAIYCQYLKLLSFPCRLNVKRQSAAYLQADYMKMSSAFCLIMPLQMAARHLDYICYCRKHNFSTEHKEKCDLFMTIGQAASFLHIKYSTTLTLSTFSPILYFFFFFLIIPFCRVGMWSIFKHIWCLKFYIIILYVTFPRRPYWLLLASQEQKLKDKHCFLWDWMTMAMSDNSRDKSICER